VAENAAQQVPAPASLTDPFSIMTLADFCWAALPPTLDKMLEGKTRDVSRSVFEANFSFGEKMFVSVNVGEQIAASLGPEGARFSVRQFIGAFAADVPKFLLKALSYANWAKVSRFCASCGEPLVDGGEGETWGARICPRCGHAFFPRISPAVIVLISDGHRILMAHNVKFPANRYGLIAGFVELGETFEETVAREVAEEAGIEIFPPRYIRSQPWPFPDSIMVGFEADYKSGTVRPDGKEIDKLGWYGVDELPGVPVQGSIARFLVDRFIAKEKDSLRVPS
jgi:NAD+ diphosphatase